MQYVDIKTPMQQSMKKIFSIIVLALFLAVPAAAQDATEYKPFEAEDKIPGDGQTKGFALTDCMSGMRDFLTAPNANFISDAFQYFADLEFAFTQPLHYADIAAVTMRLDEARYAVIGAFLRCDLGVLPTFIKAYRALEAELYFLRNFVEYSDDGVLMKKPNKELFKEMEFAYFNLVNRGQPMSQDEKEKEEAYFSGLFDQFKVKYDERAKAYAGSEEDDPETNELLTKIEKIWKGLTNLSQGNNALVEEFVGLGTAAYDAANKAVTPFTSINTVGSAFADLGAGIISRLKFCSATGSGRLESKEGEEEDFDGACKDLIGVGKSAVKGAEAAFEAVKAIAGLEGNFKKFSERRTYGEVKAIIEKAETAQAEEITQQEMLARYELLYGKVNGDGIKALAAAADELILILGPADPAGSLPALKRVEECTTHVLDAECPN